jgi:hypothetical protein
MMSLDEIFEALRRLPNESTPEAAVDALNLLDLLTNFVPMPGGPMASEALKLARDAIMAGKAPEDIEALRASIRTDWQAELDQRFPKG